MKSSSENFIKTHRIAACQVPAVFGDTERSLALIEEFSRKAEENSADLVCFPECFLQGYTVSEASGDLAIDLSSEIFESYLARLSQLKPIIVFGMIESFAGKLYNTAVVIKNGKLLGKYQKVNLHGTEKDVFERGNSFPIFNTGDFRFGIAICYDTGFSEVVGKVAMQGANLLVCPCNNMMSVANAEKWKDKHNEIRALRAAEANIWLISSDVTGHDEKGYVSYGPTAVINPAGVVVSQLPLMEPGLLIFDARL